MLSEPLSRLLSALDGAPAAVVMDAAALQPLLAAAAVLRDEDTVVAGRLRLLRIDGRVLLQEQTPDGRLVARRVASEAEGAALVADRMDTYERMWDGCGCRVEYGV